MAPPAKKPKLEQKFKTEYTSRWASIVQSKIPLFEKLICSGCFESICLISHYKEVVYAFGGLFDKLSKADIDELFISFYCKDTDDHYHSLSLDYSTGKKTTFRIYQRSLFSVYATAIGSKETLTISRLPTGLFVSLSHKSVLAHKTVTLIEDFTSTLRV